MATISMDFSLALAAAALSAMTEKCIVPKQEYDQIKERIRHGEDTGYVCMGEVNVVEEVKKTYAKTTWRHPVEKVDEEEIKPKMSIGGELLLGFIKLAILDKILSSLNEENTENSLDLLVILPSGRTIVITMKSRNSTIDELKEQINLKAGFTKGEQVLHFGGNILRNNDKLRDYDIVSKSTIHMSLKIRGGGRNTEMFFLDKTYLAPEYDYDFTNMTDDGTEYWRGGHQYSRPYGWKRYAIKVLGKYDDDKWLVNTGKDNGEWAVSYHGTKKDFFNPICKEGYKIGPRDAYGKGVYSAPLIETVVNDYSTEFTYRSEKYKGVFQNRVNPNGVRIVNYGKFWVCSNSEDIRPYALCVQKSTK